VQMLQDSRAVAVCLSQQLLPHSSSSSRQPPTVLAVAPRGRELQCCAGSVLGILGLIPRHLLGGRGLRQ
jgi:hypothetical protein